MDAPASIQTLEAVWADYYALWAAWLRDSNQRLPDAALAAQELELLAARYELGALLRGLPDALDDDDAFAVRNLRTSLPDLDVWVPAFDGIDFGDGGDALLPEEPEAAALRREVLDAFTSAASSMRVGRERLHRLTLQERLAREEDPAVRRELFDALRTLGEVVDGDGGETSPYRRLLQSSAARWARDGSPIDANAAGLGIEPSSVERMLRSVMRAFRELAIGPDLVEPWDYRYLAGGLGRRLDELVPRERLLEINALHLSSLGADPARLGVEYDIFPRPGRPNITVAFTFALELPPRQPDGGFGAARSQVFATYEIGSLGNFEELLHESGHAIQDAAVRVRPLLAATPSSHGAFWEAFADVLGKDAVEPAFLAHNLGASVSPREATIARYGGVMLDCAWTLFEIELHRHPSRRPNDVWAEIMERSLGVRGHPEWSWWATRTQLIDGPGYMANYALGAVMVAAVRARIRELRGDWSTGDPGWYAFVSDHLLQWSGAREPSDILREFLGGPLTADALLEEIQSGAA